MDQSGQIEQLVQSVQSLTTALAEERKDRIKTEKHYRMGMAGLVLAMVASVSLVWSSAPAQANLPEVVRQIELDFKEINKLLANLNPLVESLNGLMAMAQNSMATKGGVLNDAGVLVARVKQDSDLMRKFVLVSPQYQHQPALAHRPSEGQLNSEQASPIIMINNAGVVIKDELRFMNYILGSTMGKAGGWMNWMPSAP